MNALSLNRYSPNLLQTLHSFIRVFQNCISSCFSPSFSRVLLFGLHFVYLLRMRIRIKVNIPPVKS